MVITFGEIMMRLSPEGYLKIVQANALNMTFGGGEANVAVSLAQFGEHAKFVTRLPNNAIGERCIKELRGIGVDTNDIIMADGRMGTYYCEKGASQRASVVIYDRADSVIAKTLRGTFDWAKIFEGAKWFHFTGITPALSDELAIVCEEACVAAKKLGVCVSCDLNFRKKLWTSEKANEVMSKLMKYVDVLIANEEDCEKVFGIKSEQSNLIAGEIDTEGYKQVANQIKSKFGIGIVAITLRESYSASRNGWSAMLYKDDEFYFSKKYDIDIVDRVGGGDSFCAGLIFALKNQQAKNYTDNDVINYAVAASCLKHSIEGDFNFVKVNEIEALMKGDGSGRVQR